MEENATRASLSPNAMLFDGGDLIDAIGLANRFAGDGGRIATLADVVAARRVADKDELVWDRTVITASAEFVGLSRGGTPIIIVAHGIGPLAGDDGVFNAYYGTPGKPRNGAIDREEFLRLESGGYGPVEIVPYAAVWGRKHPFQECLTAEQALEDPIVRARLGEAADFYLARHWAISKDFAEDVHHRFAGHECMIGMRDPQRQSYLAREPDGSGATAHLLTISDLVDYDHGHWDDDRRHRCLVSFVSCHEWGDAGWVIGFRGGAVLRPHSGPSIVRERFRQVWRTLLVSGPPPLPGKRRIHAVMEADGLLFTRHDASGCAPDGGEPEYPIAKIERTDAESFRIPIVDGDYLHPRCDADGIREATPPWANGFRVVRARPVWEGDVPTHHVIDVEFYRIEPVYGRRIPPMAKLREDFDRLLSLGP